MRPLAFLSVFALPPRGDNCRNGVRKHPHLTVGRGPVPRRAAIAEKIETGRSLLPLPFSVGRGPVPRRAAIAEKTEIILVRKNSQNGDWGH